MTSPLPAPGRVRSDRFHTTVQRQRQHVREILSGQDDRLLVIAGPCSAHDVESIIDYTTELSRIAAVHTSDLYVVARVYAEKPRTRLGWPGMLLDPHLDAGYRVDQGIRTTRDMLEAAADLGMPLACEFVEPLLAVYLSDLVCWGAIGARTVESPVHRRLASALPMPVGFKNRTDGAIGPAVDAIIAAASPQPVLALDDDGTPHWSVSPGNPDGHVVLRGGANGPNHSHDHITAALDAAVTAQCTPRLIVDCSHGNSGKNHRRQPVVAGDLATQLAAGQTGIAGVMLESFTHEGSQPHSHRPRPGLSITDACLGLNQTAEVLDGLATAVRHRRAVVAAGFLEVS